ncbi:MAG: transglycosylase domain-containing protein, partial [Balneolaceae bacterium]|nr:transglycosylase domain-containing protein [Balneolaceae bacterium]
MSKKKVQSNKKWFLKIVAGISAAVLLFGTIYLILIWNGFFGPVPDTAELTEIRNQQASQIYSADGRLIGTYYLQNRAEVNLESVNPVVIDALLAIEDVRFYSHNGIDNRALARVAVRSLLLRQNAGGGSTI